MDIKTISKQTARRYVLGRQGLWPGRRWVGKSGTEAAIRQAEAIQIDTISIVARSHDLALWSRVSQYQPEHLNSLMYSERQFFDYGSILMVYPMQELAYWRTIMEHWGERRADYMLAHQTTLDFVRQELQTRGPLGNRDFVARERIPGGFRTIKDTGQALYYMWLAGEIMTHERRGFERIYDFAHNVTTPSTGFDTSYRPINEVKKADLKESEHFLALKALRDVALGSSREWAKRLAIMLHRSVPPTEATRWLEELVATGEVAKVWVEGRKQVCYLPAADLPVLDLLEAGSLPVEWQTLGSTTLEEVNLLAPLDNVIWDRTRTQALFDFDYVWEVYKPAHLRRWGYYTLPILFGDKLVGRFSPKLNRKDSILVVEGFWLEDEALALDPNFKAALTVGLANFATFHAATKIDLPDSMPAALRNLL